MQELTVDVVVLGAGPGGYNCAFRLADLGKKVVLIEKQEIGGVCLNEGCIPSKTLLHITKTIEESRLLAEHGVSFDDPKIDLDKLRSWKNSVIKKLNIGLKGLAKKRKVELLSGVGKFISSHSIQVVDIDGNETVVKFSNAVIATGSVPVKLPFMPEDKRIMDSTDVLTLPDIPNKMLVIGGGVIGLEMASVYSVLGSNITIAEFMDQLLPGMDKDIVRPLHQILKKKYSNIMLSTKVVAVEAKDDGLWVTMSDKNGKLSEPECFDRILVTVGRKPCCTEINLDVTEITLDDKGFIVVDEFLRTKHKHIYAIGDLVGNPMLAHKASAEGRLVAEIIAEKNTFPQRPVMLEIPSIVYTDPEVASIGFNETELQKQGIKYRKAIFPWMANGRSLSLNRQEGLTKLLFSEESNKLLGAGIVGPNAGDLISEIALAIKMGCTADDIAHTIHPHPTLSETIAMAAEVFNGTVTDL